MTIVALPGRGLLGDVLCSLAGGPSTTSLKALHTACCEDWGVRISDADLQNC